MNILKNNTQGTNTVTAKDLDLTILAGIKKDLLNVTKITLGGTDFTPASLQAAFQAEIDAINLVASLRVGWQQQAANTDKIRVATRALRALLKKYILATYGAEAVQVLGDFGLKVPKTLGPRTAAAKAKSAAKATATKEAKKAALASVTSKPSAAPSPAATPPPTPVTTAPPHA